ncbi:TonB-dependent siderophore receptor [Amphiplicatus metriothermophilus]|uniref:Iron complex outermembrane recepter protein n=1 Tax=Amphiplicatus metriothermophilus TaxID=1519374 RepID=A0A239PX72_9PROT|nr:TonB-dependent siderophore receptor [Amphiplicatus metriothermophilus]MBB5518999.1 iron complex outermembrane receptor protein [Amphiplicatus metriothermophilus]SNT74623.1 iron complex outermembrane recepter protein [Amphiplicatus metriothermophilus]
MRFKSMALAAGALVATGHAQALDDAVMDDFGDEIVVTGELSRYGATKSATPILETARSVSIETEDQFREKGALTLDDTLNYTAGVIGDTFGFSTRGDFPKIRGFDSAEYRDGQQVVFGYYNNTRSDVYMLEQVEVLKGPASVLYGKGTPGGIVNAISKLAGPDRDDELVFDIGTHDRYQIAGDLNAALGGNFYVRLVGLYRDSDTQVDFVEDDAIIVMPSITYQTGRTSLTAMVEIADRDSDTAHQFLPLTGTACVSENVSVTPASFCANATGEVIEASTYLGHPDFNRYDTNSTLVSVLGHHAFTDHFSLEGVFRYKKGEADYRQTWIDFLGAGVPRVDANGDGGLTWYRSDAGSEQYAIDVRGRLTFTTGPFEHEVFGGVAYQDVTTGNRIIYLSDPVSQSFGALNIYDPVYGAIPPALLDDGNFFDLGDTQTEDIGVYLNDQVSLGGFKINLGLRYDDTETESADGTTQKDDAVSFSAGLLYAFDFGLSPYVSYAESFEPVIGLDGFTMNPLKPQEGEQWEVGVKYQPPGTRTYITLAYFDIRQSNLPNPASLIGQPDSQQEGVGKVKGFEAEAQTTIGDLYLEGNFSILDTENPDGFPFHYIPETQSSAWVQYQPSAGPLAGFRIGAGLRYAGENESNAVASGGVVSVVTDGYVLGDLMVGYGTDSWDLTVNVRNITDEDYYGTCLARGDCFPGEKRTIVGRLAVRF